MKLRQCHECNEPQVLQLVLFLVVMDVLLVPCVVLYRKYEQYLSARVMAHVKIFASFFTVVSTLDTQFGVQWPPQLLSTFAVFQFFSFDLSLLSGFFCLFRVNFYTNLIVSTSGLVLVLVCIFIRCRSGLLSRESGLFLGTYLCTFAYPVISVKVVGVFGCHSIDDAMYLRADYSLQVFPHQCSWHCHCFIILCVAIAQCYDAKWMAMALYSSVFLVIYVAGLPLVVLSTLFGYRKILHGRKTAPDGLRLGFLLDDYRLITPCILWDGIEMLRKLILSVIGACWSDKSPMAIATAGLLSVCFLVLQHHYQPYKDHVCNYAQQMEMQTLSLMYFAGLLMKVSVVEDADKDALGTLLVLLLVAVFLSVLTAVSLQFYGIVTSIRHALHCGQVLKTLPQQDPPPNTEAFYLIQIPVEESNMGPDFKPKPPHLLKHIPNREKLKVVRMLTDPNEDRLDLFFDRLRWDWSMPLQRVKASADADTYGKIAVKYSRKTDESILAKACRPSILRENPSFSVEHGQ
jgi:hypothetical protein